MLRRRRLEKLGLKKINFSFSMNFAGSLMCHLSLTAPDLSSNKMQMQRRLRRRNVNNLQSGLKFSDILDFAIIADLIFLFYSERPGNVRSY